MSIYICVCVCLYTGYPPTPFVGVKKVDSYLARLQRQNTTALASPFPPPRALPRPQSRPTPSPPNPPKPKKQTNQRRQAGGGTRSRSAAPAYPPTPPPPPRPRQPPLSKSSGSIFSNQNQVGGGTRSGSAAAAPPLPLPRANPARKPPYPAPWTPASPDASRPPTPTLPLANPPPPPTRLAPRRAKAQKAPSATNFALPLPYPLPTKPSGFVLASLHLSARPEPQSPCTTGRCPTPFTLRVGGSGVSR